MALPTSISYQYKAQHSRGYESFFPAGKGASGVVPSGLEPGATSSESLDSPPFWVSPGKCESLDVRLSAPPGDDAPDGPAFPAPSAISLRSASSSRSNL